VKILLLGSDLNYNLEYFTLRALKMLGHDVHFFGYREWIGPYPSLIRIAMTRSYYIRLISKTLWLNNLNLRILHMCRRIKPELVLVIKGESVLPDTILKIRSHGVKTVLWSTDDPQFFNSLTKIIAPNYDHVFTCTRNALPLYHKIGVGNVEVLSYGCEPSIHRKLCEPEFSSKPYIDVSFVGTFNRSRARIIKKLVNEKINVHVFGPYWRYFFYKRNAHGPVYGLNMTKIFNASKIVLNIHANKYYGLNMRCYEVTGCGSF